MLYLAILYGLILFFVHYYSKELCFKCKKYHTLIYSFTAGITVTYIFLKLLPNLTQNAIQYSNYLFLFPLLGFSFHHLVERHIYNHPSGKDRKREFKTEHSVIFFMYHLVIGIILANLVNDEAMGSILFFLPLLFATIMTTISLKEIHGKTRSNKNIKFLLSISTLMGILLVQVLNIPGFINYALYGFAGGTLLYVVVGESIPSEKKGSPISFITGALIYVLLLLPSFFL